MMMEVSQGEYQIRINENINELTQREEVTKLAKNFVIQA